MVSCKDSDILKTTTKSYDLFGKVKLLSEKKIKANLEKDWNYSIDTIEPYCFISNKFFNNEGVIDSITYLNKDSIILQKVIYNFGSNNKGIISIQIDKTGKKTSETKYISFKDSIVYVENWNSDNNVIVSKSWTKYENSKIAWLKSEDLKSKLYSEWVYLRDSNGQEIMLKTKFGFDKNLDYKNQKIKYLQLDSHGNWIKRIEYFEEEGNSCIVKTRQIQYYE